MIRSALLLCVASALVGCATTPKVNGAVERDAYGKPILEATVR